MKEEFEGCKHRRRVQWLKKVKPYKLKERVTNMSSSVAKVKVRIGSRTK